ncbi:MAG: transporter substrate-binding domain-containing protein [Cocleimonas sp.]|nr:transporter substrate-binding domain-containing protein [Cocleimonas sp.]
MKRLFYTVLLVLSFSLISSCSDDKQTNNIKENNSKITATETTESSRRNQQIIRFAVEGAYPPFSDHNKNGNLIGFDIEIAKALCIELDKECKLITQKWDKMIPELLTNEYDAIVSSMSITEKRKKKVLFTQAYYQSPARFIYKKGVNEVKWKGMRIGVQKGANFDRFLSSEFKEIKIKRYGVQGEAYQDLLAGKIDMVFADAFVLLEFLNTEEGQVYDFFGESYTNEKYFGKGLGIAVRKENTGLRDQLNWAIDSIRKSGVYSKIRESYFDFNI